MHNLQITSNDLYGPTVSNVMFHVPGFRVQLICDLFVLGCALNEFRCSSTHSVKGGHGSDGCNKGNSLV